MQSTLKSLRALIWSLLSEEVGRNIQTDQNPQRNPWDGSDVNVEVYPDSVSGKWWVSVETSPGEFEKTTKPTQEEADHWARQVWERVKAEKFAAGK